MPCIGLALCHMLLCVYCEEACVSVESYMYLNILMESLKIYLSNIYS